MDGSLRFLAAAATLAAGLGAAPAQALTDYSALANGFLSVEAPAGAAITVLADAGAGLRDSGSTGAGASDVSWMQSPGDLGVRVGAGASGSAPSAGSAFSLSNTEGSLFITNNAETGGAVEVTLILDYLLETSAGATEPSLESAQAGAALELWEGPRLGQQESVRLDSWTAEAAAPGEGDFAPEESGSESFSVLVDPGQTAAYYLYASADGSLESALPASEVPVPAALPLGLTALAGFVALARGRRR
ncbi:MAG: hypothetical protein ACQEUZ_15555 [Pseudomonadota bacterium]